jgi:hypothetical protein
MAALTSGSGPAAALDNVGRGQLAGALPEFDLERGMLDLEALV